MSLSATADHIVDRRKLRRQVTFWRIAAFVVAALAIIALFYRYSGMVGAHNEPHIARLAIRGLITGDDATLMEEIARVSAVLKSRPGVDKINIGALGNIVRQLHVHVVARSVGDAAWPGPVWGSGASARYEAQHADAIARDFAQRLVGSVVS